jgi:hypothetical protein
VISYGFNKSLVECRVSRFFKLGKFQFPKFHCANLQDIFFDFFVKFVKNSFIFEISGGYLFTFLSPSYVEKKFNFLRQACFGRYCNISRSMCLNNCNLIAGYQIIEDNR